MLGSLFLRMLADPAHYDAGPWVTETHTVIGKSTPPAAPSSISAQSIMGGVRLLFTCPQVPDFHHASIWRNTSAAFPGGNALYTLPGAPGERIAFSDRDTAYGQTYYYWLKSYDTSGNASPASAAVQAAPAKAQWNGDIASIPANLSALTGTEAIRNNLITINADGTLSGAGSGQVTTTGIGAETPAGAQARADAAEDAAKSYADAVFVLQTAYDTGIADLQNQIDGSITTWFYDGVPTLANQPAVNWTTTELKNIHLGDIYYDNLTGYAYRFMLSGTYQWARITDSDITAALQAAQSAQDTADAKRRVFVAQPSPPYDLGDLWDAGGSPRIIKRCTTARASGGYVAGDWTTIANYTTSTSQLTDGAGLGTKAVWSNVTGTGKPQDNANYTTNTSQLTDGAGLGSTALWSGVTGTGKPADNADVTNYGDTRVSNNIRENGITTISRPIGATFEGSSNTTGAIVITFPVGYTNTMLKFLVDVYQYIDDRSFSLSVGGYNYAATSTWYHTFAHLTGSVACNNRVRFGDNGTKCVVVIGETNSVWQYPKIAVKNFQASQSGDDISTWDNGWSISVVTSLTGYAFTADISDALIDASTIKNQGTLATKSSVSLTAEVTNKSLANLDSTANTKLSGIEAGADVTSSHTAAAIAGQGSLATKSSVSLATEVTNKSLANLDSAANTKLSGIEAGADVTASHTAAAIANQGALATLNQAGLSQLASDAIARMFADSTIKSIVEGWRYPSQITINGGSIQASTITATALAATLTFTKNLVLSTNGKIYTAGKTSYADTTAGIFAGYDSGAYKFKTGNSTQYLGFNGANVEVGGDIIATGNIKADNVTRAAFDSDLDGVSYGLTAVEIAGVSVEYKDSDVIFVFALASMGADPLLNDGKGGTLAVATYVTMRKTNSSGAIVDNQIIMLSANVYPNIPPSARLLGMIQTSGSGTQVIKLYAQANQPDAYTLNTQGTIDYCKLGAIAFSR